MIFNTRDMPNVSFEPTTLERLKQMQPNWDGSFRFRSAMMGDLFKTIYLANPTWRFQLESIVYDASTTRLKTIHVSCEGEKLGYIEADYFRGNHGVAIANHRINKEVMRTSNDKRALGAIKKYFVKRNINERLEKAQTDATQAINSAVNRAAHAIQSVKYKLETACLVFVMDHAREAFAEFSKVHAPANLTMLEKYDKEILDADTIEEVRSKYSANNAALVVLDQGKYIVKTGDNVQLFDDNDLPEQIRGRLGLLKLVEYRQMVTNAGCRISGEVFVVVLDEEGANE
jgi:hypothetical protein